MHDETPEAPSSPVTVNATGFVYHPSLSGPRDGLTETPGGDESFLTVTEFPKNGAPYQTVQVNVAPEVSSVTVTVPHPCVFVAPAS